MEAVAEEIRLLADEGVDPIEFHLPPVLAMTDDQFFEFCQLNDNLWFERTAEGGIIVMPPAGSATGDRNSELNYQLRSWNKKHGRGKVYDSSAGFKLANGAVVGPDASWVLNSRLTGFTQKEREKFLNLCPDFVAELRSSTDRLSRLQRKMEQYIANGARLGWLIDPRQKRVHIYRPGHDVVVLDHPSSVSGDPELPGLVLDLTEIWDPL